MKFINLNTEIEDLRKYYLEGNNIYSSFPTIEEYLNENDLIKFIKKHQKEEYIDLIIEKIFSKKVPEKLVELIFDLFKENFSTLNEIVMSGHATESMLNELSNSNDIFLSQHSKLSLLIKQLDKVTDKSEFNKILNEYPADVNEFNNSARFHIATHKNTSTEVLKNLILDSHKHISEAAQESLDKKDK